MYGMPQHHGHHPPQAQQLQKKIFPLDPVSCALYTLSAENVRNHVKHVHEGMKVTATRVKEICMPILEQVLNEHHALSIFGSPVDPVQLGLPDYFDIIKAPMDLGSVRIRLQQNNYRDMPQFMADVHLTFDNATQYNSASSEVHQLAKV
jgi:E1A/CREB-binding protein